MATSLYHELIVNPPVIKVDVESPREVHFATISCMCDNKGKISFYRNDNGSYRMTGNGFALSNWQMKDDYHTDCCWAAEDGEWDKVANIINTGTTKVQSVKYR